MKDLFSNFHPKKKQLSSIPIIREASKTNENIESRLGVAKSGDHIEDIIENIIPTSLTFDHPSLDFLDKSDDGRCHGIMSECDTWFEEMQRRFDFRRRQWDEDIRETREKFFTPIPGVSISKEKSHNIDQPLITDYQITADGNSCFVVRFKIREHHNDELQVQLCDEKILIKMYIIERIACRCTTHEFNRSVELPKGVNYEAISAAITTDNWLVVTCPIHRSPIKSIFPHADYIEKNKNIENKMSIQSLMSKSESKENLTNQLMHLDIEIPIGNEFMPEEINVKTLKNRVFVYAKHEEKICNRSEFREFSKEYDIPDHIDPKMVSAKLENGVLHLSGLPFVST